jgi:hypothetical protein
MYWVSVNAESRGPFDIDEIQSQLRSGALNKKDLVWENEQWVEIETAHPYLDFASANLDQTIEETANPPISIDLDSPETKDEPENINLIHKESHNPSFSEKIFDGYFNKDSFLLREKTFLSLKKYFHSLGIKALYGGVALQAVLFLLSLSVLFYEGMPSKGRFIVFSFLAVLGAILLLLILLYSAEKVFPRMFLMLEENPVSLNSTTLPLTFGLLFLFSGISSILIGGGLAILEWDFGDEILTILAYGLFQSLWGLAVTSFSLNPQILNIKLDDSNSAGEEVLGLLSFSFRSTVMLTPIIFGLTAALAFGATFISSIFVFISIIKDLPAGDNMAVATGGEVALFGAALLPLITYIGYILYTFMIDIGLSILSIPRINRTVSEINQQTKSDPGD